MCDVPRESVRRLGTEMRAGLDLVRASAAIYVVIYHVAQQHLHGPLSLPFRFGQEAVIVFFLLSGFVIFANEHHRVHADIGGYVLRRVRRIYPPMLISLLLAMVLYSVDRAYAGQFRVRDLVATLLCVQDISALKPGVIADPFLNNNPLWSLSYEVTFYLLFPLTMMLKRRAGRSATHIVGLTAIFGCGTFLLKPNHWSLMAAYFILWWAGAVLADLYLARNLRARAIAPVAGWILTVLGVTTLGVWTDGWHGVGYFPGLIVRHFAFALGCVALTLTPLTALVGRLASKAARPTAYIASISYGLYVFHYPLLVNWSGATHAGLVVAVFMLVALAWLGDRKLDEWLPKPSRRSGVGQRNGAKTLPPDHHVEREVR